MTPHFFCEDALHESVIRKVNELLSPRVKWSVTRKHGKNKIARNLREYNRSAGNLRICALVDLNGDADCAPAHKSALLAPLRGQIGGGFCLIIAVREAEAWLLADRKNFAAYLGVAVSRVPPHAEEIADPKRCVIDLAKDSRKRDIREDIVPRGSAKIGAAYNLALSAFVAEKWDICRAAQQSPSLAYFRRTLAALARVKAAI